jgi:Icc-related predicted phosphoesterase
MTNCRYLQDEAAEIAGLKFWGSPWQPWFHDWAFNLPRGERLAEKWAMVPEDTEILVTHGPPFGIGDHNGWEGHVGCDDLRKRVAQLQNLKLHIFGHIHESPGVFEESGVVFANVSWRPGRRVLEIEI